MPILNEKQRRRYLGSEAEALGHGGIEIISKISGISRKTVSVGMKENREGKVEDERVRKAGGGRKSIIEKSPEIIEKIENIVSESTYGNPENPLIYTTKSTRKIQSILKDEGYKIGHNVIGDILELQGYSNVVNLSQKHTTPTM